MADESQPLPNAELARFSPFDSIDPGLLAALGNDITTLTAESGFQLFRIGEYDAAEYYLLQGSVKLTAEDGREKMIVAGDNNARFPIARLRPRMFTARAQTDIRYFVIAASVVDELQGNLRQPDSPSPSETLRQQAAADEHAILHEFEQELDSGRFTLPSLPEVAFRIREMIEHPDCSVDQLAKVVNTDPAIAAKLIKVANSVMYRGVASCDDTLSAILRLGLITTKQLVTSFAVLALFETRSGTLKRYMREAWQQSVDVAAYSYVLARNIPGFNEEEALLAGLIHNIGEVVVLSYAERFYDISTDSEHLEMAIANLKGPVGARILSEWDFNPELIVVARDSGNWMRESDDEVFDYCDLIQVAMLYALQGNEGNPSLPDMHSVPAFNKLKQRRLSEEQTSAMITEAQLQIEELREIFA